MLGLMNELLEKLQRPGLFVHPAWLALLDGVTNIDHNSTFLCP